MLISKLGKIIKDGYTGAGIALVYEGQVLMQLRVHPAVWSFVGGGFDKLEDKSLVDTALREFWEETGIRLTRDQLHCRPVQILGFWKYKWILYLAVSKERIDVLNPPKEFKSEWQRYRYVDLARYREELAQEPNKGTFLFVPYQIWKIRRMLRKICFDNIENK